MNVASLPNVPYRSAGLSWFIEAGLYGPVMPVTGYGSSSDWEKLISGMITLERMPV